MEINYTVVPKSDVLFHRIVGTVCYRLWLVINAQTKCIVSAIIMGKAVSVILSATVVRKLFDRKYFIDN